MKHSWKAIPDYIYESDLWLSEPMTRGQAWADLWILAAWKDRERVGPRRILLIEPRGCVCRSGSWLARRWQWTTRQVRCFLQNLQKLGHIETTSNNTTTWIYLNNYDIINPSRPAKRKAKGKDVSSKRNADLHNSLKSHKKNSSHQHKKPSTCNTTHDNGSVCDSLNEISKAQKIYIDAACAARGQGPGYRHKLNQLALLNKLDMSDWDILVGKDNHSSKMNVPDNIAEEQCNAYVLNYLRTHCSWISDQLCKHISSVIDYNKLCSIIKESYCTNDPVKQRELINDLLLSHTHDIKNKNK